MSSKSKFTLFISVAVVLIGIYFVFNALKDDAQEIEEVLDSVVLHGNIIHIEHLNKKNAIAFYVSEPDNSLFGHALVKKNIFGWKFVGSSSTDYTGYPPDIKLGWSFSNLEHEKGVDYTDLIYGKVIDDDIKKVKVITEDGKEYLAETVTYGGNESFWYLLSDNKDLSTATITGITETGEVIFEYPEK